MYAGETQKLYMPHQTAEWTEWSRDVAPCQGCGVGLNLLSVVGSLRFRCPDCYVTNTAPIDVPPSDRPSAASRQREDSAGQVFGEHFRHGLTLPGPTPAWASGEELERAMLSQVFSALVKRLVRWFSALVLVHCFI